MYQRDDLSCFSILQLFKRRNVASVEDDSIPEDDGMADSGYLESQANNMDPLMVRGSMKESLKHLLFHSNVTFMSLFFYS